MSPSSTGHCPTRKYLVVRDLSLNSQKEVTLEEHSLLKLQFLSPGSLERWAIERGLLAANLCTPGSTVLSQGWCFLPVSKVQIIIRLTCGGGHWCCYTSDRAQDCSPQQRIILLPVQCSLSLFISLSCHHHYDCAVYCISCIFILVLAHKVPICSVVLDNV